MSDETLHVNLETQLGDFRLQVQESITLRGVVSVFGPSGCGKSTLLKLIAGLIRPDTGYIRYGGMEWEDRAARKFTPAHLRSATYVFQDARLLPHLSVQGNLNYALSRSASPESQSEIDRVIAALELQPLLDQFPSTLSGGQRRRVAIAQGVLTRPKLLLLDEPLNGLDEAMKQRVITYLKTLYTEYGMTCFFVSHDMSEVLQLATSALVMKKGIVLGHGSVVETLNAYGFTTKGNTLYGTILSGAITTIDKRLSIMEITVPGGTLKLSLSVDKKIGSSVHAIINASDVALATEPPQGISIQNVLRGNIRQIQATEHSSIADILIDLESTVLPSRITRASLESLKLRVGMPIYALIKTARLMPEDLG